MIARKSFLLGTTQLVNGLIGFIGLFALSRLWGEVALSSLGSIQFAISFLAIFNLCADLGYGQAHIKKVSEGKDLKTCLGTYISIKLLLTGAFVIVTLIYIFLTERFFSGFPAGINKKLVIIIMFYFILQNFFSIAFRTFDGLRESAKRSISSMVEVLVRVPLMIILGVYFVRADFNLALDPTTALALCYVMGLLGTCLVSFYLIRGHPVGKPSAELARDYTAFALRVALIPIITVLLTSLDKVMIGFFWSEIEVGYYFYAYRIASFLLIVPMSIEATLFPTVSNLFGRGEIKKIEWIIKESERYSSLIVLPISCLLMVVPVPVLSVVFGEIFSGAAVPLVILSAWVWFYSCNVIHTAALRGANRPEFLLKIGLTMCMVNIGANLLLVPKNGILAGIGINGATGAALATLLTEILSFIFLRIAESRVVPGKYFQIRILKHVVAGGVSTLIVFCAVSLVTPSALLELLFSFLFIPLSFIGILALLHEFGKKDIKFFLNLISPDRMLEYISSELSKK
jgi:O-antigen/teichoic acid export membrane protein